MNEKEIGYILVILAELFFIAVLIGAKDTERIVETVREVEVIVTPTPAPKLRMLDREDSVESVSPNVATPTEKPMNPWTGEGEHQEHDFNVQKSNFENSSSILQMVRVTCYLPTGFCCADGTMPREGICAGAPWQIGKDCILYDIDTGEAFARLECRDTGGHYLLQSGQAIDVFRNDIGRAWEWVGAHGDYAMIEWVERGTK